MSKGTYSSPYHNVVKRKTSPLEDQEQIVAATWLSKNDVLYFHIPNGGKRNLLEALKFQRMGVKAGIPDLCIPIARKGYHGLWIELKRLYGGVLSDSQKFWHHHLTEQGYLVTICHGAEQVKRTVCHYLGMKYENEADQAELSTKGVQP